MQSCNVLYALKAAGAVTMDQERWKLPCDYCL